MRAGGGGASRVVVAHGLLKQPLGMTSISVFSFVVK